MQGESLARDGRRNFLALAAHQIVMRIGWIFKTESIVIPAFLDYISPAGPLQGVLRGCLPMLNRFGHSVPPVLFARRLKVMRRKKWALLLLTIGMSVPFLTLAAIWWFTAGDGGAWLPWVFLGLYGIFFAVTGMNQLTMHTLQGKLVEANYRGRLASLATTIGAPAAILAALLLMPLWLGDANRFDLIFGFTGLMFLLAAGVAFCIREPTDDYEEAPSRPLVQFASAWRLIREDANFRRLAGVAVCYSTVLMMFPHYQAMGRQRLGLQLNNLTLWVAVQNAGTFAFMFLAGPLADHRGTRLVLRATTIASATTPLLAIALAMAGPAWGGWYPVVFITIGLTPVTLKTMANYTLEIAPTEEHPRYVSTLGLCFAAPIFLFSPLLGLLISLTSFELVFAIAATVILFGALLAWRLAEPRHEISLDDLNLGIEEFEE
jgi:hypothetical protein